MATEMQRARELVFGADGLGASNFKMFPGSNREVTAEQVAAEIVRSLNEAASAGEAAVRHY